MRYRVVGHFKPRQIFRLLLNLNSCLSQNESTRIFFDYPSIKKKYFHILGSEEYFEDGVNYVLVNDKKLGFAYRVFDSVGLNRLIETNGFEIDIDNSIIQDSVNAIRTNYLCLKPRSPKKH